MERAEQGGRSALASLVRARAEPFLDVESADLAPLLRRIGDARVVLLGEATHGTSEFYRFRARLTRALVEERGFDVVAVEGDWPDAAAVDDWISGRSAAGLDGDVFARFPRWMWRNREVADLLASLRAYNASVDEERRVGFYGLDLYSLFSSLRAILDYLDRTAPELAGRARERYACLMPWEEALQHYGRAASFGATESCERDAVAMLRDMLERRLQLMERDGGRFFDAMMNARVVANAERYYRAMFQGADASWNLRDEHMVDTLQTVLAFRGPGSRAVVWAHNSHVGDARATWQGARGQLNIGQLARERFGDESFLLGFGTDRGTVAAATDWDGPMEVKTVLPSRHDSWERVCHDAGLAAYMLPLRDAPGDVVEALAAERLERAIGVIYRPETERFSHYFEASLSAQFDEWIWIDRTHAVTPLSDEDRLGGPGPDEDLPETFPSGL